MAIKVGSRILYQAEREIAVRALGQALDLLGNNPGRNARYVTGAFDYLVKGEKQSALYK